MLFLHAIRALLDLLMLTRDRLSQIGRVPFTRMAIARSTTRWAAAAAQAADFEGDRESTTRDRHDRGS